MSVIFKEKEFDQLLILINNLLIIILSVLILLTAFNFISSSKVNSLNKKLELLQGETLKYETLLKSSNNQQKLQKTTNKESQLLISLADYAENIIYNSIHFKNESLKLKAVSGRQNYIFALIDLLEADPKFKEVELINLNQREAYYFELKILIAQ